MTNKQQAIYDARTLGSGKMLTLGLQHMFAMFGATVKVSQPRNLYLMPASESSRQALFISSWRVSSLHSAPRR